MNFGAAIKALRTQRKISQRALADSLGCSNNYISLLEVNKRKPSLELLELLCQRFDTKLSQLFLLAEAIK